MYGRPSLTKRCTALSNLERLGRAFYFLKGYKVKSGSIQPSRLGFRPVNRDADYERKETDHQQ